MLINCFNFLVKFEALWRMQYIECRPFSSHPTYSEFNADKMVDTLYVIKHKFDCGVTF